METQKRKHQLYSMPHHLHEAAEKKAEEIRKTGKLATWQSVVREILEKQLKQ